MNELLILFAEPSAPDPLVHATFANTPLAPNITLSLSNTRMTRSAVTGHGQARSSVTLQQGRYYWETRPTSGSSANMASGIALPGSPVSARVGDNLTSLGIWTNTGNFVRNGAGFAGVGAVLTNDVLRHYLDLNAGTYAVQKNAGPIVAWAFTSHILDGLKQGGWQAACSSNISGHGWDLRTGGSGATAFLLGMPEGWQPLATQPWSTRTVRLATEGFVMPSDQVWGFQPNQWFDGRISNRHDVRFARQVASWQMDLRAGGGVGALVLSNADGALDEWRDWRWRDLRVKLLFCQREALAFLDPNDDNLLWSPIVEKVEFRGSEARIVFVEPWALADRNINTVDFGDQANEQPELDFPVIGEALEGRLVPLALGRVDQVAPPNVNADPAIRQYQYADGPCLRLRAAYDKCDPWDLGPVAPDVFPTRLGDGLRMSPAISGPDGKVTVDLIGTGARGAARITLANGGAFTTWPGGVPAGWSMPTTPTPTCRFEATFFQQCRILTDGTSQQRIEHPTTQAGGFVEVQFSVLVVTTPGVLYLRRNADGAAFPLRITGAGVHRAVVPLDGLTSGIGLMTGVWASTALDCIIDDLQSWQVTPADTFSTMAAALFQRMSAVGSPNLAGAQAIDAAAPWPVGLYADQALTFRAALQQLLDSFSAWAWTDRFGVWHFGRLRDPIGTPVLELTVDNLRSVECRPDLAPGLTTRVFAVRNYSPTDEAAFAGSVSLNDRRRWSQPYQVVASARGGVHPNYVHGEKAAPRPTLLQSSAGAAAEARFGADPYRAPRNFYPCVAELPLATARTLAPNDLVRVTFPRHGLAAGKKLLVLATDFAWSDRMVPLLLWG